MSVSLTAMASWHDFVVAEPQMADAVRAAFAVRKHCTLATLRADGAPRISGTEVQFTDTDVCLGMMPDSMKAKDVLRDPRVAVHSPTVDPADETHWVGEAKFSGIAELAPSSDPAGLQFRIAVTSVVFTGLTDSAEALRIQLWRPEVGREVMVRQ